MVFVPISFILFFRKLWIKREIQILDTIESIYTQHPRLLKVQQSRLLEMHTTMKQKLHDALHNILNYINTASFRASRNKTESFLQFLPINLHKQICKVAESGQLKGHAECSMFTLGAHACHHLGFDHCGLKSMLDPNFKHSRSIGAWILLKKLMHVVGAKVKIEKMFEEKEVSDVLTVEVLCHGLIDIITAGQVQELVAFLYETAIFTDELEPVDLIYLNLKACLVTLKDANIKEMESCQRKLTGALESLRKLLFLCYLSAFLQLQQADQDDEVDTLAKLRFRSMTVFCQAITSLIMFVADGVASSEGKEFLERAYLKKFILVQYESYLNCFGEEYEMVGDMTYALDEVASAVKIVFKVADKNAKVNEQASLFPCIDLLGYVQRGK